MVPFLPHELVRDILEHVTDLADLAACCGTSQTFSSFARTLLYRRVTLCLYRFGPGVYCGRDLYRSGFFTLNKSRFDAVARSEVLLATLRGSSSLRHLVRDLIFHESGYNVPEASNQQLDSVLPDSSDKLYLIPDILDCLPSIETVTFFNTSEQNHLDQDIARYQARRRKLGGGGSAASPAFRIIDPRSGLQTRTSAAYDGFSFFASIVSGYDTDLSLAALLEPSHQTLTRLESPLLSSADLSAFARLEHLALRLAVCVPPRVVVLLERSLSAAQNLRSLHLRGHVQEQDLVELIGKGRLAELLPPLLSHLSIEHRVTLADLSRFVDCLSTRSNVRRLNLDGLRFDGSWKLEDLGRGEEQALALAREKGIRLTFRELWTIWW